MAEDIIKTCVDRVLPSELIVQAAARAIEENPANAPAVRFTPGVGAGPLPPPFLAVVTGKKWQNGRTLRVRFLDGDPAVQAKLQPYAQQWSDFANITFVFGDDPNAEIRISFRQPGSWSFIGTDALTIAANEPTMNFGWLNSGTADEEYSRVVIHEFGHALGCIHEHSSPVANIPWDKEAVYRYYMGPPNNWSKAQVDFNLFERYSQDTTQFTQFDRESIMLYPVPNQFTIGDFEVGWNTRLSTTDKEFIGTIYPLQEKSIVELTIDAGSTEAEIGAHEEVDNFKFSVPAAGRYIIETEGQTDVVMTLFGPDDETKLIAEDDDSGSWTNAKLVVELAPGTYYVRIRHYRPTGTGTYSISVRTEK